jgi:hypothetical protein
MTDMGRVTIGRNLPNGSKVCAFWSAPDPLLGFRPDCPSPPLRVATGVLASGAEPPPEGRLQRLGQRSEHVGRVFDPPVAVPPG